MKYDDFQYLWPPRPEQAIPAKLMSMYVALGWVPQVKKNGTCTLIFARGGEVRFMDRHGGEHKAWTPLQAHGDFFRGLHGNRWQVYVAELLHSKTPYIKHQLYLFDVLVADGEHLVGMTQAERQRLLAARFPAAGEGGFGSVLVAPYITRAVPILQNLIYYYRGPGRMDELAEEDEGFVFKDPKARLAACLTSTANGAGQVKCRRTTKNYSF